MKWRYQRKTGWGDIWRETEINPAMPGFFETPEDWRFEPLPAVPAQGASDSVDLARSIAFYLDEKLEYQPTGKDPKNDGFAFAKVPEWQLKQWGAAALELARRSPVETRSERPKVAIKPMELSGGRTDYFVSIKVGDREVTPHVFREEYKAAYHVALYDWLLNGSGEEPDVVDFGPEDYPARSLSPAASNTERQDG